jgi:hypothetical protein
MANQEDGPRDLPQDINAARREFVRRLNEAGVREFGGEDWATSRRIDHRPRRRRDADVLRASLVLPGQSFGEAVRLYRGAIYWAAVYGDGAVTLMRGVNGETLVNVRNTRRARSLRRRAALN